MKVPLVECVEQLHAAGYVVLGPENAELAAELLGQVDDARAEEVLAAFPDSFIAPADEAKP